MENIDLPEADKQPQINTQENIISPATGTSLLAKLKTKWPIVLGVLGSIAIFAAIIYAAYSYSRREQEVQPSPTLAPTTFPSPILGLSPSPMETIILNPDLTANWETYTNTKYKYTLKYPQTWQVSSLPGTDLATFHEPLFSSKCDYEKSQLCTNIFVLVTTFNPEANIYDGDVVIDTTRGNKVTNEVSLRLDNENARGFVYWQESYGEGGRLQYFVIAIHKNNKYTIMYEEEEKGKKFLSASDWENKKILDQILSTFKFLD